MRDEPKDHAVTRGRDESLRYEGGYSPEYRTLVLETTSRRVSQIRKAEHVVVIYCAEVPEHLPRTDDHEVAQAE